MSPAESQPPKDLYEVLQVHPNASPAMIRRAYGWLAKEYHPDKNPDRRDWAEQQMRALNEAFETLSDPGKRQQYNATYTGPVIHGTPRRNGFPPGWEPMDPEWGGRGRGPDFNPARSAEERRARRSRYYTSPEEAYASADAPPGSAAFERRRGQDYVERKRYDRAIRHFRRSLNLDPGNPQVMVELAMAYYLHLNLVAAREWLERALEHDAAIADAHYMLGMICLDESVLQAIERDASGRPSWIGRSQRRYFTLLGRAVEHFEKAMFLSPVMFRKQFTFFPVRKSVSEYAAAVAGQVRSVFDFSKEAQQQPLLRQALLEWYYDHAQAAFLGGSGSENEFITSVRRHLPRNGSQMFLNSWAFAALRRGLELFPEDLTLLKACEKLLANGQFLGEQPMSKELSAELRRMRSDLYLRIRAKDAGYAPTAAVASRGVADQWGWVLVGLGMTAVVVLVWQLVSIFTG